MSKELTPEQVLAILIPEPATAGAASPMATAMVIDPLGGLMLQSVVPNRALMQRARVAGRWNEGTPIVDPQTREVIGYELSPLAVA